MEDLEAVERVAGVGSPVCIALRRWSAFHAQPELVERLLLGAAAVVLLA
jgi:hypothetical protein